jgi:glycosyltransferase involved in cell wall biosynthesis
VIKKISAYISENPVDAIITTGPPHSVNRIGALLKKKFNLPWISDFQDPWTQVDYYKHFKITSWAHARHRRMENEVFAHADLITIVSDSWKADLQQIGAKRVKVIPLGFDPDDFKSSSILDQLFSMTHLGLLGEDRNPETLLHVIKSICLENSDFENYFRLNLVGKVNPKLPDLVASLNLKSNVFFIGQVSRELALKYMQNSQLLLLLLNKAENVSGRIPGKIFEYMGAKRPVISLGPIDTDVSRIISNSRLGQNIPYDDFDALKEYMLESYGLFRSSGLHVDNQLLKRYSHEEVSATFVHYLNQISST